MPLTAVESTRVVVDEASPEASVPHEPPLVLRSTVMVPVAPLFVQAKSTSLLTESINVMIRFDGAVAVASVTFNVTDFSIVKSEFVVPVFHLFRNLTP